MSVYSDNDDNDIQMLTNVVKAEQDENRPLSPPSERVTIDLTESDADASAHPNRDVDSDASVSNAAASRSAAETNLFAVGAAYDSIEAFKLVADQFARAQGFSCIKLKGNNRKDGVRYTQVIACDRTGSFKPKVKVSGKATRNKDSKKCGCEWFIRLNHDIEDGTYKISQASLATTTPSSHQNSCATFPPIVTSPSTSRMRFICCDRPELLPATSSRCSS